MSNLESLVRSAQVYFADVTLVAGNVSVAITDARFQSSLFPSSQFLGCVRKTAGGTVGSVKATISSSATPPVQATTYNFNLNSTNVADTSVYTVYWRNEFASVDSVLMLTC